MDSSFSTSSRRTYDIPKPETGLAEWTSKIKALQREVDADEEAEQKRLEEEISAARQARLRRSRGAGPGSRVDSIDMSSTREQLQRFDNTNDTSANDTPKSISERVQDQETALRKLMGRNDVYNPDRIAPSSRTAMDKSDPVPLAAFIGGRATGPRLNRHAPQQDAHDPTQFIQPDLSAPHPIFGKGGIAMPGMAAKKDNKISSPIAGSEISERYRPSSTATPLKSPPASVVSHYAEKVPEQSKQESVEIRRSFTPPKEPSSLPPFTPNDSDKRNSTAKSGQLQRNQNSFGSTPKSASLAPLSKKEEPSFRESSPLPSKPADTYRSNVTPASRPLPSYLGTANTAKPISGVNAPRKGLEAPASVTETPLRRIMETNHVYNPDKIETPRKTIAERAQTVSLAAFMGGNATGPRLNRHAPQPDAHDPTQYIQPDTSAPHPVFGRGGIAMPGLAIRKITDPTLGAESSERYRPSSTTKPIWPPVTTTRIGKVDERPVSPQKTGNRERTSSAPSSRPPLVSSALQSLDGRSTSNASYKNDGRQSPMKENRSTTPVRDRTISGPSYSQSASTITTPSLARPIQPKPKMSSLSPQVLGTTIPSPAFQKSTPPKDLTPSISRLQGRGFVQNMVKVSAQLEIPSSPTPAPSDKSRPTSAGGRKSSVLDRWQSNIQTNSPTKLQSPSPSFPNSIRRSTTQEISGSNTSSPRTPASSTFPSDASHTLKSVASLPSMAKATSAPSSRPHTEEPSKIVEPYQRSRTPGLGSATTMVLIKPSKSVTDLTKSSHVDELGVKHDSGQGARTDRAQFHISAETPSSKKPLIHPTKDRARKPKKHSESHSLAEPMQANLERDGSLASPEQEEISHSIPLSRTLTLDSVEISSQMGKENHFPQLDMGNSTKVTPSGTLRDVDAAHVSHASPNVILSDNTTQQKMIPSPVLEGRSSIELAPLPYIPGPLASPALKSSDGFVSPAMKPAQVPLSPVFSSPSKAIRIPSTGNRPTVMEVAQTLIHHPIEEGRQTMPPPGVTVPKLRKTISPTQAEKRKSSYEKYLAIALPPLKEEATPTPSPAGTLNRANARLIDLPINNPEENNTPAEYLHRETNDAPETSSSKLVDFVQSESPVPHVEIARLLESRPQLPKVAPDTQTVSVEVLAITGTTATTIVGPLDVFYESEILAIIHRVKSKSTGLASTFVWCWLGRQSILGDREERKLHDLAKRYGASAKIIHQLAEPSELIQILGGSLAIRQGTRVHWSPENTTMHLVRSLNGVIVIDEHDLDVKNLCSAFSYCLTVLGSIYVWHGCGSTPEERNAALKYSKKLSDDAASPIELLEGETDNDEMFWMILGDDGFAKADYWKWRKSCSIIDPSIWRMVPDNAKIPVVPVEFISMEQGLQTSVYVVNCIWELFVLVGKEARSDRQAIRLALDVAMKMSKHVAFSRPYAPTVHALILPSKIPLDLRRGIRDFDEAWLNDGEIPDHMNLLSYSEAVHHLSTHSWEQPALRDRTMLPLGVGL